MKLSVFEEQLRLTDVGGALTGNAEAGVRPAKVVSVRYSVA